MSDERSVHRDRSWLAWAGLALMLVLLACLSIVTVAVAAAPGPADGSRSYGGGAYPAGTTPGGMMHRTELTWTVHLPLLPRNQPPPPPCFGLDADVNPPGSGLVRADPPPDCEGGLYTAGTLVTLKATAAPGWAFVAWTGDLGGDENPSQLLIDGPKAVTATFSLEEYSLTVATSGGGAVDVEPLQATYYYGDLVTLSATPDSGWAFSGWSGDLTGTENPALLFMDGSKTVTATFDLEEYTLVVGVSGDGSVVVDPAQPLYYYGDVVTLTAIADPGWVFSDWTGDLSGEDNPLGLIIDGDKTVTATFSSGVEVPVVHTADDAEEWAGSGAVDLARPYLELGQGGGVAAVGLRFQEVAIPPGASITRATVEFSAAEPSSQTTSLTVHGQAGDDAPPFSGEAGDLSNRPTTAASVLWSDLPPWTAVHASYRTPDLSPIIQEIVDREGWESGNALVLIVTGAGRRTAVAFDGEPALAPRLRIAYEEALPPRTWDPRLDELGVTVQDAPVAPGTPHWRLVEALWADPVEAAGRHSIYLDVSDADGQRIVGQPVVVGWPGGSVTLYIEDKPPPEYGANFAMYATLGSYDAWVGGGEPSDRVVGMGLGTPEYPDVKYHTCFYLKFQWIP